MIELNSILETAFQRAGQSSEQGSSRRTLGDCPMTLLLGLTKGSTQHPYVSQMPPASLSLPVHRSQGTLHGSLDLLQGPLLLWVPKL